MTVKKAVYKVDNGSGFDEIHYRTDDEMVTLEGGSNLKEELKKIPRFKEPNFTFSVQVPVNGKKTISHNLGYEPQLFCFKTTLGNVNPTFDVSATDISICNYNGFHNDCWVSGRLW